VTFAAGAVRDEAIATGSFRLGERVVMQAGGGYVRYGVPGGVERGAGICCRHGGQLECPRALAPIPGWQSRIGYQFAGEYLSNTADGRTGGGQMRPLLDVRSREAHALEMAIDGSVGPAQVTLLGGYAIDRYGGSGPLGLLSVADRREGRFGYGLEASVGPSLAENARAVWRVGGFLA